jgi:hypothetical protein
VARFDPLEVDLLARAGEGIVGQLGEAGDDFVDVGQRFLYETNDTEVSGPGREIGIVDRRHEKRR